MKYKYYPNLINFIKPRLKKKFPSVKPKKDQRIIAGHLLWMMEEMQKFDPAKAAKRGRWIGWVIAHAEILNILTNTQSRKLAEKDSHSRNV